MVLANAFALTSAILWSLCSAFIYFLPDFYTTVTDWWLRGLDISILGSRSITWANFAYGGVALVVSMWIAGYILGWVWEMLSK